MAVTECSSQDLVCGCVGCIVYNGLDAQIAQLCSQNVSSVCGVAVNGCVSNHDTGFLRCVGCPLDVLLQELVELFAPYKAVQGADHLDLNAGSLLHNIPHLRTVLTNDVGVVTASLIDIIVEEVHLICKQCAVECAEGAECIGGEQNLFTDIIGHHNLRPVHHGCCRQR